MALSLESSDCAALRAAEEQLVGSIRSELVLSRVPDASSLDG